MRNIWLQSGAFLLLALFSTVLLTSPFVTAIVLAGMLLGAIGLSLVFERRAFCRYLCPVGGFIGLYSQVAPVELRIKNKAVCVVCNGKPCYNGSAAGYGCPWDVFPGGLRKNTYCGLCMECMRTCPHDNIGINLRPFAADLQQPAARMDEAFKGFVMLGSAIVYSAVLLGPWGFLKEAAYRIGTPAWFLYVVGILVVIGLVLPGAFALCVAPRRDRNEFRQRFARLSTGLIPLGLTAWIAFSLSFVLTNGSYVCHRCPIRSILGGICSAHPVWLGGPCLRPASPHFRASSCGWCRLVLGLAQRPPPGAPLARSGDALLRCGCVVAHVVAAVRRPETIARAPIVVTVVAAVAVPLFLRWRTPLIDAWMPESGGWSVDSLRAAVGVPLHLRLTSDDVVHGFAVGKLDAPAVDVLPGKITDLTLLFDRPGTYTFYCTRWCGLNHWRMRGTIEVDEATPAPTGSDQPLYATLGIDLDVPRGAIAVPAN